MRLFRLLLLTSLLSCWQAKNCLADDTPTDVRVMSFNIRYGTAKDGENHWDKRKDFLLDTIRDFNPDLLGTQETLGFQRDWLADKLPGYGSLGVGRDDGQNQGEMMALYYRQDRFALLESGHFWLSETPEVVGSKSWDSALPRMASWVKLKDMKSDQSPPILFLNTHFDHMGQQARLKSAELVRQKIVEMGAGTSVIVTGDFNTGEGSEPYDALFAEADARSPVIDCYRAVHPQREENEGTFSGFDSQRINGPRIDWIAASRDWMIVSAETNRVAKDGRTPSDHFPVQAILQRK